MRLRWTEELKTRFAEAVEEGGGLYHVGVTPTQHMSNHSDGLSPGDSVAVARTGMVSSAYHREGEVRYQTSALPACSRRTPSKDATTLLLGLQVTAQQILMHMGVSELTMAHVKSHLQQQRIHEKIQSAEHHPYGSDSRQASEGDANLHFQSACLESPSPCTSHSWSRCAVILLRPCQSVPRDLIVARPCYVVISSLLVLLTSYPKHWWNILILNYALCSF